MPTTSQPSLHPAPHSTDPHLQLSTATSAKAQNLKCVYTSELNIERLIGHNFTPFRITYLLDSLPGCFVAWGADGRRQKRHNKVNANSEEHPNGRTPFLYPYRSVQSACLERTRDHYRAARAHKSLPADWMHPFRQTRSPFSQESMTNSSSHRLNKKVKPMGTWHRFQFGVTIFARMVANFLLLFSSFSSSEQISASSI